MAEDQPESILVFGIKGRTNPNIPYAILPDQCAEAINIDFFRTSLARKRNGASSIGMTGATFTNGISSLFSHVAESDQAARELWSVDDGSATATTNRINRLTAGVVWANMTLVDVVSTTPWQVNFVTHNGKLVLTYDSPVNRLHEFDPLTSGTTVIRMGLAGQTTAATVANTGAGAYPATIRYYKVAFATINGAATYRKSDLTPSVSFTPSGAGTHARVTRPTAPGETETHWLLYASPVNADFTLLATVAIGTTTFDDNTLPAAYDGELAADPGAFTCPPSGKFLALNDNRLIIGGAWETTAGDAMFPSARRVYWTSALGSTDQGDDERISNTSSTKSYADFEEALNGISPAIQGSNYIFSYNSQWKFVSTSVPGAPFIKYRIGGAKGCIEHKTIIEGEDEDGDPCIYWLSPQGPMRKSKNGDQSMVDDVADIWDTVNLAATRMVGHGVFHKDRHQIWWWVATGSSNDPDTILVFDTRLGVSGAGVVKKGWSEFTGTMASARCSTMMSNTLGASMSRDLKPYLGKGSSTAVWKCDDTAQTTDAGTQFQAYIKTRPYTPWGIGMTGGMQEEALISAKIEVGTNIDLTINRDFGIETRTSSTFIIAAGAETRVTRLFENSAIADCSAVQFQIGDSGATTNPWTLDLFQVPLVVEGRG